VACIEYIGLEEAIAQAEQVIRSTRSILAEYRGRAVGSLWGRSAKMKADFRGSKPSRGTPS